MKSWYFLIILLLAGCGSSDSTASDTHTSNNTRISVEVPTSSPCAADEFYRLQAKECLPLAHPKWGFQGFDIPTENIYTMQTCKEEELEQLIADLPPEGGKIILKECTIKTYEGIVLDKNNIILEGAGVGKTILSNKKDSAISLHGKNIIVRNLTVENDKNSIDDDNTSLNGINGYKNKGNILIEFVEARNFKKDQGAGISFLTEDTLEDSNTTIRYCTSYGQLHGIVVKVHTSAKMLIYSNNVYENREYGLDISTSADVEVSGNSLHDNHVAGAKTPAADNIFYRYNDINYNGKSDSADKAGIVYPESNPTATITLEYNDLTNNGGKAFVCWSATLDHIILRENLTGGSTDSNGYHIGVVGAKSVDVYGYNGKIWAGEDSSTIVTTYP